MKILFQTRTNLYSAPGGDLVQIESTKKYLEKLGCKIDISLEFEPNLSDYDIVHIFNLMDPQDIYLQFKNAQKQNKKIVLSTIYGLYTEYERKASQNCGAQSDDKVGALSDTEKAGKVRKQGCK